MTHSKQLSQINTLWISKKSASLSALSENELLDAARSLREQLQQPNLFNSLKRNEINEAAALAMEAIRRTHGFTLYPVQIQAAVVTACGYMIEMQTGEGKTVVAGAAAIIRALANMPTHVATTNYYLAKRDFDELEESFASLGLKGGCLPDQHSPDKSRRAYDCDITYGPGYQFGFDFLFDQITLREHNSGRLGQDLLMRLNGFELEKKLIQCQQLNTAIIDEADSVLVDEATTPLILAFPSDKPITKEPFRVARKIALDLEENIHFEFNAKERSIKLTEGSKSQIQTGRAQYDFLLDRPWETYIQHALQAEKTFTRDEHYIVHDGKVKIVDQFTGRIFEDRSWQSGLHQAVETKENLELSPPRESRATITRQRFVGFYETLSGMSGTMSGVATDLSEFYNVKVVEIPTQRASKRIQLQPRFFTDIDSKLRAIAEEVKNRNSVGQPVLIGTQSIAESMLVAEAIKRADLNAVVLNGVQDQEEADIVAIAGQKGAITIATNMAGRGTDIKPSESALKAGGLHVIGSSPSYSERVDRQLVGRCARQGQPGSAHFFISADDCLVQQFAPKLARQIQRKSGPGGEAAIGASKEISAAQNRYENKQFDVRREMVMHDHWMDSIKDTVFGETVEV